MGKRLKYKNTTKWVHNIIGLLVFIPLITFPQSAPRRHITGKVIDAETGESLYGANIMVKGTVLGAAADMDGRFRIDNLLPGVYQVEASMMGYKNQTQEVNITASGTAQDIVFQLKSTVLQHETILVTATKRKQHIEDAPTSVDIVSSSAIRMRNAVTLDEVLRNTAGFSVIDGQIDLRGSTGFNWAAGSRVLLMVDGHPLINGDTGGISWDAIPIEEVERVEIVKGAGSALYGSNAMAGMVNIIIRDPSPIPETRFKLSWGIYDEPAYPNWRWTDRFLTYRLFDQKKFDLDDVLSTKGIDLSHSRQIGNVGLLFTVGRKLSTGFQQNGDYSRWNAMGKAKIRFSPIKTLSITGNWAYDDHGDLLQWLSQDSPMEVPEEELGNRVRNEKGNVHITYQHVVSGKFAYTLKSNVFRNHWKNFFYDNEDYARTDRIAFEAQGDYVVGNHAFTFGSEVTKHHTNSLIYGIHDTWDYAVYLEDELKFSPLWTLNLGSRFDHHRVQGISADQQISPRMGLVFHPWGGTSIRLSAGHGFRAPSIAEVFASITVSGFRVVPNLDLKEAERAWSLELGMRQAFAFQFASGAPSTNFRRNPIGWLVNNFNPNFILDLAFFWSRYKNMIDVNINPELLAFQFINLGRARNQGLELRLMGSLFDQHLSTTVGYTLIDPLDLDLNRTLNYRSKHRLNAGIQLNFWRLTFGWDYRYASRMEEVVEIYGSDERVPMHVMDGRIIFDLNPIQISLEGKNLRNYHYTLRQRMLEPVRQFVATLRGNF